MMNNGEKTVQENNIESMESFSLQNLLPRLDQLINTLSAPKIAADAQLWTLKDIAAWMNLSVATVYNSVITRADFPVPLQPCDSISAQKRWFTKEIMEWAKKNRNKNTIPQSRRGRPRVQHDLS